MTEAQIAAIAGEYYVAHKVAMLGLLPTLVRQRSPRIDALVAHGSRTVGLQIRSAFHATRDSAEDAKPRAFELRFPLGHRALASCTENTFFCFVDLKRLTPTATPDVYVVPGAVLKQEYDGIHIRRYTSMYHQRPWQAMQGYRNNWDPLISALRDDDMPATRAGEGRERHAPILFQPAMIDTPGRHSSPYFPLGQSAAG